MGNLTPDEPVDILLIEDNPGDVRLTREAFDSVDSDVEFHVVTDGEEAARYVDTEMAADEASRPDLVLLDLNLPRMDGFAVLEILHRALDYPPPPVIVLSSSDAREDIVRSYERAANAYLTKPDDMTTFNSMARAIEEFWIETVRHPPAPV